MMPDNSRTLLGYYEAIGHVSQLMVHAASRADWNAYEHAHSCCEQLITCLQATGLTPETLDSAGRRRRLEILRQVLADDRRIRDIAQPGMSRLDRLLRARHLSVLEQPA
jgi:flagellar protein FliT